jgi:hypothetical protein
VLERFETKTTLGLVGEFNKLRQWADVPSERSQFEEFQLLMLRSNPSYVESEFGTITMSGFREY